jgi:hypothetical protein
LTRGLSVRTILRTFAVAGALLLGRAEGLTQSTVHFFPQFVDGKAADGSHFRSTLTIMPWTAGSSPSCTLLLYGMAAAFDIGASGDYFTASVPANSVLSAPTSGKQPLQSGYGVLYCSDYVYSNVILSYYAPDKSKIGEATVISSQESVVSRMALDVRGGVRHAIAIANNTDFRKSYVISLAAGGTTRSVRVIIPARRNLAKFVDDILPVEPESIGVLTIQSEDLSFFSTVGFRFTGSLFTSIPAEP